ncbi:MAG: outer membrane protein assembly factor BamA [Proteobacteria bacterium]|nr:outer membrane protein assembly factor BamA [Pseudomonadota bacterium]
MKLKSINLLLAAALAGIAFPSWAVEPFVIRDIRVEGLQRTDAGTIFNYLPVKVGDRFDDSRAQEAIKALFATGFFNDVRVESNGNVLIVTVDERPTIAQINVNGSKMLEKDQIKSALKSQSFAEGRIFDQSVLDAAVQEIKQQYYSRGRYSVVVKTEVTKLERNRVGVQLDISEGEVARIQQINIVGNKAFSEDDLLDMLSQTTGGWLTWYTKADQYSKQKLSADMEKLRSWYMDRGYIEFNVDSTQVAISEDREGIFLTLNIAEGKQFEVSDVKLLGDTVIDPAILKKLITLNTGDVFSRENLNRSTAAITEALGDVGYAFANVNAVPEIDQKNNKVAFTFYVDPGKKTYVRRINVNGNSQTRDVVIRRELRQLESAAYDGSKIKRSKQRLEQLDYFGEIVVDTPLVPDTADQVDMNVTVTEKKSGNFNIGAGYGQSEGVVLVLSLSQNNFLGSGKQFAVEVNSSSSNKVYSLGVTNPYATPDGVSVGWNLYRRDTDPSKVDLGNYTTSSYGFSSNFSLPLTESNRIGFGLGFESLAIQADASAPQHVLNFVNNQGARNKTFPVSVNWGRDTRNSGSYPTSGWLLSVNGEVTAPFSDVDYYKLSTRSQYFIPFGKEMSLMWNVEGGYGHSYGDSLYPFYKNFYAGGVGSIRGFRSGSVGPVDSKGDGMGGDKRIINNFEFFFPIPGLKNDRSTRLSVFADSGAVWGAGSRPDASELRYSAGVAFTWVSPVGPIKLSWAAPFNAQPTDRVERGLQFQLGQVF